MQLLAGVGTHRVGLSGREDVQCSDGSASKDTRENVAARNAVRLGTQGKKARGSRRRAESLRSGEAGHEQDRRAHLTCKSVLGCLSWDLNWSHLVSTSRQKLL